jgi:hypothetical protein
LNRDCTPSASQSIVISACRCTPLYRRISSLGSIDLPNSSMGQDIMTRQYAAIGGHTDDIVYPCSISIIDVDGGFKITRASTCTYLTTLMPVSDIPPHTHYTRVPVLDRNRVRIRDDVKISTSTVDGHRHNTLPGGSIELQHVESVWLGCMGTPTARKHRLILYFRDDYTHE